MSEETELQLVQRLQSGDARAFHAFYTAYFPRLYRFVLARSGGDVRWVEDVTQRSLVQAMRGLHGYRGDASLFSWLCRIGLRELMHARSSQLARDAREVSMEDAALAHGASTLGGGALSGELLLDSALEPEAAHERTRVQEDVHALLDALPPRFGDVLELKYLEGLSVQEIANRWQTGTTAVQSLLARARVAFRAAHARRTGNGAADAAEMGDPS